MEVKRGAMEIIENLLFGDNVKYLQCSKCKVKLSRVDTIVLHSTVGAGAISSALYLGRPDTSVSAHVVVGRDAEVFQLLPTICRLKRPPGDMRSLKSVKRSAVR